VVTEAKPPAVLVVEANPITSRRLAAKLEGEGYEVIVAASGAEAFEAARGRLPDLVLQDLILPDIDALELVWQLRSLPGGDEIPIIALTGFFERPGDELAAAATAGFTAVLVKPIEPSRLKDVVRGFLPQWRQVKASPGAGKSVLLVGDDPVQLKLTRVRLDQAGFEVTRAIGAEEALRLANETPPDIVVSDALMTGMDGFELCFAVRRDSALAGIPVVLISTWYKTELDRQLALQVGANELVSRTPGLDWAVSAILEALHRGAPPVAGGATDQVRLAHSRVVIRQLERRLAETADGEWRCSLQTAQISVLSGVARALAERSDVDAAVGEVLAATLDSAGISKAALFLSGIGDALELRHAVGFPDEERQELATLFGQFALLERAVAGGAPLTLPSAAAGEEASQAILAGTGTASAQLFPLVSGTRVLGVILLAAKNADVTSADGSAFARAIGNQLAQALALADSFARIAASEERYRSLMEHAEDAISILTPDGIIREVNGCWEEVFGRSRADVVGRPISTFDSPGHEQDNSDSYRSLIEGGSGRSGPITLTRADGSELLMEFSVSAIEVAGERLVLSIGRDVSKQVRSQAQLMVADRMVSIGMLAAGVAHEINNPLAAVCGNLELATRDLERLRMELGESLSVEPLVAEIADAREAADRVRAIARDLKVFSSMQDDRSVPVDVHRVLDSSLRLGWNEIRHRATVVKEYGAVPLVRANESRLGQVFLNLLVNAAQALPEGSADTHRIRVTTRTDGDRAVIDISDDGPGMSAGVLRRLFTPFFTTKAAGVGTGLGLAICERIVNGLGGEIGVFSEVGHGTTFRIRLPAAELGSEAEVPSPGAISASRRGRILVVDDERMVSELMRRMLAPEHEVEISASAQEALARIAAGERFDVILCDLMMPVMTGMDLYAELARLEPAEAERVIFVTGGAFTVRARAFLDDVSNPRVEKPFDVQTLRRLVNERLRLEG